MFNTKIGGSFENSLRRDGFVRERALKRRELQRAVTMMFKRKSYI